MENNLEKLKENIEKYNVNKNEVNIMLSALYRLNNHYTPNEEMVDEYIKNFTKSLHESFSGKENEMMFSVEEYIDLEYCAKLNEKKMLTALIADSAIDYIIKNQKDSQAIDKLFFCFPENKDLVVLNIIKPIIENNVLNRDATNTLLSAMKAYDYSADIRLLSSLNLGVSEESYGTENVIKTFVKYYIDETEALNKGNMLNINTVEYIDLISDKTSKEQLLKIYGKDLNLIEKNADQYIVKYDLSAGNAIAVIEDEIKDNNIELNKNEIAIKNLIGFYMQGNVNSEVLKDIIDYSGIKKIDPSFIVEQMILDSNEKNIKVILDEFEKVSALYEKSNMLKLIEDFKDYKTENIRIEFLSNNKWFQKEISDRLISEFENKNNGNIEYAINLLYVDEKIMSSPDMKDNAMKNLVDLERVNEILEKNKERNRGIVFESEGLSDKVINKLLPYAYKAKESSPEIFKGILNIIKREEVFSFVDDVRFKNEEDKFKKETLKTSSKKMTF